MSATATGDGSGTAVVAGASAIAAAGQVAANGTRAGITVDVTEDMICEVVRGYIKSIAGELRVIRTPVNKASMPDGPFVTFTPGVRRPLSTNVSQYDGMNARSVNRPEQMTFQIDCYGEGSSDLAETLNTLFRDQYAVGLFAQSPFGIAPLYANDIMQAPFVNDADQYEERYLFEIVLQVNSVIALPQQYCKMLSIDLISVDAFFPPEEVA